MGVSSFLFNVGKQSELQQSEKASIKLSFHCTLWCGKLQPSEFLKSPSCFPTLLASGSFWKRHKKEKKRSDHGKRGICSFYHTNVCICTCLCTDILLLFLVFINCSGDGKLQVFKQAEFPEMVNKFSLVLKLKVHNYDRFLLKNKMEKCLY